MSTTKTAFTTTRNTTSKPIDWAFADEATLVRGVLDRDRRAVAEFMSRFRGTIDKKIKYTIRRYSSNVRSTDTVEEIRAAFYERLLVNNMSRLRSFDPNKGNLTAWLSLIAQQTASRHMSKRVEDAQLEPLETVIKNEEEGFTEGAAWVAHGEDAMLEALDFKRFVDKQPAGSDPAKVIKKYLATKSKERR